MSRRQASPEHRQVRVGQRRDLRATRESGGDSRGLLMARSWLRTGSRTRPRHAIGQRRLADTLRPADQPGMVQAALRASPRERRASPSPVAEEGELLARMQARPRNRRARRARSHAPSAALAHGRQSGRRAATAFQIVRRDLVRSAIGVDDDAAPRVRARQSPERPGAGARGREILLLEAVGRLAFPAPRRGSPGRPRREDRG